MQLRRVERHRGKHNIICFRQSSSKGVRDNAADRELFKPCRCQQIRNAKNSAGREDEGVRYRALYRTPFTDPLYTGALYIRLCI